MAKTSIATRNAALFRRAVISLANSVQEEE